MLPLIFGKSWKCQIWTHTCSWYLQIDIFRKVVMFLYRNFFLCLLWKTPVRTYVYLLAEWYLFIGPCWYDEEKDEGGPLQGRGTFSLYMNLLTIEIVQFQEKTLLPLSNSTQWSQINEYRETFNRFDADGNGSIDAEELGKLIRVLGWVGIYFQITYITCSIGNCYNSNLCSIGPVFVLGWVDISIHLT